MALEKLFEKNKDLFLCFIDLEKTFDRDPRQKLFDVLSEYGGILEAINSLYVKSSDVVRIDGELNDSFEVNEGIRQVCCLLPLLFIIFIDKIIKRANIQGDVEIGVVIFNLSAFDLIL